MEAQTREEKAREIIGIDRENDTFFVPSQSGRSDYMVRLSAVGESCTCPDHQFRKAVCKHILAARKLAEKDVYIEAAVH